MSRPHRLVVLVLEAAVLAAIGAASHAGEAGAECIAPVSYFALDMSVVGADANGHAALGSYERISPDGRFVLRSWSGARLGEVSLIELPSETDGPIRAYETPLSNEAFPVQGSWRYLIDVNGDHYRFADVLRQQARARPLFTGGMTGFYAAASEMSARQTAAGTEVAIRSLSWPQAESVGPGGAQGGAAPSGTGPLQIRTIRVQDDGAAARIVADSGSQFICTARSLADGNVYGLPMISIDGTEFSAVPQAPETGSPTMRVYGLSPDPFAARHACDQRIDLGHSPSKAVFGFANDRGPGHAADLSYTDNASVYVFDRGAGPSAQAFRIDDLRTNVLASAFPGLTRDGRVVFGATWKDCVNDACSQRAGYVVADPWQSTDYKAHWAARGQPPPRACITRVDVARERAGFADAHGLPR